MSRKNVIGICLILVAAVTILVLATRNSQLHDAQDADLLPRGGYTLVPDISGEMGIDISSSFTLTAPHKMPDALPVLLIDGQPQPVVTRQSDDTFLVTPAMTLSHNNLYIFRLERDERPDVTWAFQTAMQFQIASTLPGHQSTNVPVDTGIEIVFSARGEINITDHFSIYPHVEGRFIHRGATAIFMPASPLDYEQIYTVTVSAGTRPPGGGEAIAEDLVFSFETSSKMEREQADGWPDSVSFSSSFEELPSFEPPRVNFRLNYNRQTGTRPTVHVSVYRLDDREQAVVAARQLIDMPHWSRFSRQNSLVDTADLQSIASFDITQRQGSGTEILAAPDVLPAGFYLVNAAVGDQNSQMIVQITDLAVQIIADDDIAIVWVNDMATGIPVAGAQVYDHESGNRYQTDENGLAVIERGLGNRNDRLTIRAADGKESVVLFPGTSQSGVPPVDKYWTALQLDRTLFKRDDTLHFWGFVQGRHDEEELQYLTAMLTQASWLYDFDRRDVLHRQIVSVRDGVYSGEINLPNLDYGWYRLIISHGDIVLRSIHFSVEDYVTPSYRLIAQADRVAMFVGEAAIFTTRAEFFEGTPVSELEVNYSLRGWQLQLDETGRDSTDLYGEFEITIPEALPSDDAQGETSIDFSIDAYLPEAGRIHGHSSVRVFVNDINMRAEASREGENASLSVKVYSITLDRLNDGSARHWDDFLDTPVAGQVVSVEIDRIYWVPVRSGEFYCFIERAVVPRYRHERREEAIDSFELRTNAAGEAEINFIVPGRKYESYRARLTTTDGNGRVITSDLNIGHNYNRDTITPQPFLNVGRSRHLSSYHIGDTVEASVMLQIEREAEAELIAGGSTLFVVANGGILEAQVGRSNQHSFEFAEMHLPNATVYAFHFNGHTYHPMTNSIRFDNSSRELVLDVATNLDSYGPGDLVWVNVTATDRDGNPKAAHINLSVVDEALFALRGYTVYTRGSLYRTVHSGVRVRRATHRTFVGGGPTFGPDIDLNVPATGGGGPLGGDGGDEATFIREDFEDTAAFAVIRTNARGEARYSFRLPDNITSWRLTTSGITADLYAGNDVQNIIVTKPMFVHYALNDVFLVGDRPTLGVNVYGTDLTGRERVNFEVWSEDTPEVVHRARGRAFERVNIPLWEMTEEGEHALIIRATANNGLKDTVRHSYTVASSHRLVDTAVFYDVTRGTVFEAGRQGLTRITFTDAGRGQFLRELLDMRHLRGARLEGLVLHREATRLIETYFPETETFTWESGLSSREYQQEDGGLAMLPHAASDLALTVMLMPFIADELNTNALRDYLYYMYEESSAGNAVQALYGLAMLGKPVLLDLQNYALAENLPVRDFAYVALGLAALGETDSAAAIYNDRILPHLQIVEPYFRIYTNSDHRDILETTSVVALLSAQLGMPERAGLHGYVARNHTDELVIHLRRLSFISREIASHDDASAAITYTLFGEEVTRNLASGQSFTLRIPAQSMGEFNLVSVTGEVSAVSIHRTPLDEMEIADNDITVTRKFFREGGTVSTSTFEQGDLIRVQIAIDYSATAVRGSYMVTDFLPAGLVPVSGSLRFASGSYAPGQWRHATIEGQRIAFFDLGSRFDGVRVYYYYARVVSPGTFRAEGTIVQNLGVRGYLTVGEDAVLTILG